MAENEEYEFDLEELEGDIQKTNKVEQRIKDLSRKVKLTSEERDEKDSLLRESQEQNVAKDKEIEFLQGFSSASAQYPGASEYQEDIKAKVMSGYSVEDATVSVLAKEGKLTPPAPERSSPTGGSAINQPASGGPKPLSDMSSEEMRAQLVEAEKRGDISV